MKVITDKLFIRVFQDFNEHLTTQGIKYPYMWINNKSSLYFHNSIQYKCISFQIVPIGIHWHIVYDRYIITFKVHLIVGILLNDPDLPM